MTRRALALVFALAVLAVVVIVSMRTERGRADARAIGASETRTREAGALESPQPARTNERTAAEHPPANASPSSVVEEELGGPAPPRPRRAFAVTGRVVDERGDGIEGAEVWFEPPSEESRERVLFTHTGSDGRIEGEIDAQPWWASFLVLADGHERGEVQLGAPAGDTIHLGTIVLGPGADVRGVAVDGSGAAVQRASILACPAEGLPEDGTTGRRERIEMDSIPWTRSDEQGRFDLRGVGPGAWFVAAAREDTDEWAWSETIEVLQGVEAEVRIVLPLAEPELEADRITGVVRAPDGQALDNIGVSCFGREGSEWRPTDLQGRFAFEVPWLRRDGGVARIVASDPKLRFGTVVREGIAPGTHDLELVLAPPRWILVELRDPDGRSIPWGHVRSTGVEQNAWLPDLDLGRSGKARILAPVQPLAVEASAPGFRSKRFGPYEPDRLGDELVLVLEPGQALRGRVTLAGRPVAGAMVDVNVTSAPGTWRESSNVAPVDRPFAIAGHVDLDGNDGTTDRDGAFVVTIPAKGWYSARVEAAGFPTAVRGPFAVPASGFAEVEIVLERGGALEGRVLVRADATTGDRIVGVSDGWGWARTVPTREDGSYRFDDLAPGNYQVRPCAPPVGARAGLRGWTERDGPVEWDCSVRAGATTHFDLDLRREGACVLVGRVRFGQEDLSGWWVALTDLEHAARHWTARIERDGSFRLALDEPGRFRLEVATRQRKFTQQIELSEGVRELSLARDVGRLRLRRDTPITDDRRGSFQFVQEQPAAPAFKAWLVVNAEASLTVPAGPGRIQWQADNASNPRTLAEIEIRAGEETSFTVPADLR